ncbi:MAG: TIGR02757 family protein [bacterium]
MVLSARDVPIVKKCLDRLMETYGPSCLDSDPLGMVHPYTCREDREVIAFFSAALAFGNAKSVRESIRRVSDILGSRPAEMLRKFEFRGKAGPFANIVHRWVGPEDMARFAHTTGAALRQYGSLEALFMEGFSPDAPTLQGALVRFRNRLISLDPGNGQAIRTGRRDSFPYLLPDPSGPSACKRLHLFLKWMVRPADGVDLGLWLTPRPSQLIIPVDTHIARIGTLLGLTDRRTADRRMADEITASLRLLNPDDPVSFDFAITRLGILGHCPRKPIDHLCAGCPLQDACRHWRRIPKRKKLAALEQVSVPSAGSAPSV